MQRPDKESTEERILAAARRIFIIKGMEGARMQEIADEAGINKALLHYYFCNKEKLFKSIFRETFHAFFSELRPILMSNLEITQKLDFFVDTHINFLSENPYIPQFLISEVNRDPSIVQETMELAGFGSNSMAELLGQQLNSDIDARHLIASIFGMCIFPYAARPLLQSVYFKHNNEEYLKFLDERKAFIRLMLHKLLQ